jgi:hypothetical protein
MADDRSAEARCRRVAQSMGYRLESSRRRDSRALNYGSYRLIELRTGRIVVPGVVDATGYGASLAEIAQFLEARTVPAQAPPRDARPATRAGRHRRT